MKEIASSPTIHVLEEFIFLINLVFIPEHTKPIFFVANRGHHADVGGIMPGSMPSNSTSMNDEGAVFKSFKLVKDGIFQENDVTAVLL
ncbi:5-oxoprolinase-like isoform X2 [Clavelina lepadiformis]|uniref:5-oxoprolinase-like isoform X2 n=1 Tax=Clavelina lepadiformis TaxID=159417 RepID=UPI00404177E1